MKKSHGYTLIELLIVIAIVAILFTIGYVSFRDYSQEQSLLSAVRTIRTDVLSTKELALSGDKPSTCNTILNNYKFSITSGTTYSITANCSPNDDISVKDVTVPAGFTLTAPTPNPITFKVLADGTNIALGATASILVTQTSTGNSRAITIGGNGDIQ